MGERGTPRLTAAQVTAILRRHGFLLVGTAGSHQKWRNPATGKLVIVPYHRGRTLPLGTVRSIIGAAESTAGIGRIDSGAAESFSVIGGVLN